MSQSKLAGHQQRSSTAAMNSSSARMVAANVSGSNSTKNGKAAPVKTRPNGDQSNEIHNRNHAGASGAYRTGTQTQRLT